MPRREPEKAHCSKRTMASFHGSTGRRESATLTSRFDSTHASSGPLTIRADANWKRHWRSMLPSPRGRAAVGGGGAGVRAVARRVGEGARRRRPARAAR